MTTDATREKKARAVKIKMYRSDKGVVPFAEADVQNLIQNGEWQIATKKQIEAAKAE